MTAKDEKAQVVPSWDMGCGHFDSLGDPDHDCSTWDERVPVGSIDTTTDCAMCGRTLEADALCPHEDPMCWRDCQIYHVTRGRYVA